MHYCFNVHLNGTFQNVTNQVDCEKQINQFSFWLQTIVCVIRRESISYIIWKKLMFHFQWLTRLQQKQTSPSDVTDRSDRKVLKRSRWLWLLKIFQVQPLCRSSSNVEDFQELWRVLKNWWRSLRTVEDL